ncbi:MAG: amidohydrolase family protein [Candidatus Fervidibacter sp.]|uniref:amidohydrolase family protein n=1 Tax=Candidatus Fervidibacter sp. TaxID=3100871 RepID=UPI00404B260A
MSRRVPKASAKGFLLLRASWLLPITSPPIRDGAVLVENDQIVAVGKASEITREVACQRLEFPNGILIPGLVNPHTHLENTGFAETVKRPQPFNKWLLQMVRLVRNQKFEDALSASEIGTKHLVKFGITCVGEFSRFGASLGALEQAGLRGTVFKEFICLNEEDAEKLTKDLERWLDEHKTSAESRLLTGLGPHSPYTVTPNAFRRALKLARERNLSICVHAAESPSERKLVEQRKGIWRWWLGRVLYKAPVGLSPIRYLDWLGALSPKTLLVHCVQVDDLDIAILSERKVWAVHCPRSNANLKVGTMPLAKMLASGVKVCLATDGLASVDSLSPLDEIRFATQLGQQEPKLYPSLPPSRWLRMVTLDAASALGLDKIIGSLEPGKQADITVFQLSSPVNAPFEALLGEAKEAVFTMVAGKVLHQLEGPHP